MEIKSIKRPWEKKVKQGNRYNRDPFYHTSEWRSTRTTFFASEPLIQLPPIMGIPFQNRYCVECWKRGKIVEAQVLDHKKRIKDGGSKTDHENLQGLCNHDHAVKSANEANETRKI